MNNKIGIEKNINISIPATTLSGVKLTTFTN